MLGAQWNRSPMPCPQYDRTTWHLRHGEVEQHHDYALVSYTMCDTPPCRHSEMTCGMIPTVIAAQHVHVNVSSATPPFASVPVLCMEPRYRPSHKAETPAVRASLTSPTHPQCCMLPSPALG